MPARAPRARPLAALALAALAAVGLTGCQDDGTGLRDEGPATGHARSLHATAGQHAKRPPGGVPGGLRAR